MRARNDDPAKLARLPPALLIACGRDSLHGDGVKYAKLLEAARIEVQLREFPSAALGFTHDKGENADRAEQIMTALLSKHLSRS